MRDDSPYTGRPPRSAGPRPGTWATPPSAPATRREQTARPEQQARREQTARPEQQARRPRPSTPRTEASRLLNLDAPLRNEPRRRGPSGTPRGTPRSATSGTSTNGVPLLFRRDAGPRQRPSRQMLVISLSASLLATGMTAAYAVNAQPSRDKALAAADAAAGVGTRLTSTGDGEDTVRTGVVEEGINETEQGFSTAPAETLYFASYEKTYKGLRVVGSDKVVAATGDGTVHDTTTPDVPTTPVSLSSTTPTVTSEQALATTSAQVNTPEVAQQPQLVVHLDAQGQSRLAWHTIVEGTSKPQPLRYGMHNVGPWGANIAIAPGTFSGSDGSVTEANEQPSPETEKPVPTSAVVGQRAPVKMSTYVDATTGAIIETFNQIKDAVGNGHHNGKVDINVNGDMRSSTAKGATCSRDGRTLSGSAPYGSGKGTDFLTGCVDAIYAVEQQVKMLKAWTGRNGIDGKGNNFPIKLGLNEANAFWNGSSGNFGRNYNNTKLATSMDVVAHEFGHGIFQFTGSAGDADSAEAGLNESTADIFGAMTEHYAKNAKDKPDYVVGESVNLSGNGPIRNMYNPGKLGDPNCYSSSIANTEVHKAAGPQNHWFYLLAEGSKPAKKPESPTCNNKTVKGIGIKKAGKIFMSALNRRTSRLTHISQRRNTLVAAKALYKNSCTEFNAVRAAWDAVKVPKAPNEPTCTAKPKPKPSPSSSKPKPTPTSAPSPEPSETPTDVPTSPPGEEPAPQPSPSSSGTDSPGTEEQPTGTSAGKPPTITKEPIVGQMKQLVSIVKANGGHHSSGSAGHKALLNYVEKQLKAAGFKTRRQKCTSGCSVASDNLIADYPGGTGPLHLFGAHLDGVKAGPGTNDNGSGSMTLLTAALEVAKAKPTMKNRLRFAWWTDEEQGLNGSAFYARTMKGADKPKYYFNFDMTGSINGSYFVNNLGTAPAKTLSGYFAQNKIQVEENYEGRGRSDDASFSGRGIPSSGFASGASSTKSSGQAKKWGGKANQPYDPCYHKSCDTGKNYNTKIITHAVNAVLYAIWKVAVK